MLFLYIILTSLLYPLTFIIPFLSKKGKIFLDRRKLDRKKVSEISFQKSASIPRVIWLHAASVGELDQCKAQAKAIKESEPQTLVIQSVFSESVQEKNFDSDYTYFNFHLPLDFYFAYNFIFEKFHPDSLVLMAWETWPNLILAAKRYNCKVYLASAVLDPKSKRTSFMARALTRSVFKKISGIAPVNESMISAFQELSGENTKVISCGDSRFDSVVDKIKSKTPNEKFTEFVKSYPHKKILLLASTYSECEKILFPKLREILDLGYSVWIFPHKIDKPRIDEINNHLHAEVLSYSLYSTVKNPCKDRIVLFDVLGILAFAYFHGSLAYIGGAVHNKVHNVLEPAYFGLPLMTGEKILNSFDAINLRENKSLTVINSSDDFFKAVQKYSDEKEREKANTANKNYVLSRTGASEKFYQSFLKK
ncbi:MAG: 3-deoxy-D-manno-octulosonic acid transferase [Leptospiraceae bacterium]|nr:3-deoxy-D-manno-octulosonic acid transferase [Leptospiraceae bacterium]